MRMMVRVMMVVEVAVGEEHVVEAQVVGHGACQRGGCRN